MLYNVVAKAAPGQDQEAAAQGAYGVPGAPGHHNTGPRGGRGHDGGYDPREEPLPLLPLRVQGPPGHPGPGPGPGSTHDEVPGPKSREDPLPLLPLPLQVQKPGGERDHRVLSDPGQGDAAHRGLGHSRTLHHSHRHRPGYSVRQYLRIYNIRLLFYSHK